jgi:hypothetical protein
MMIALTENGYDVSTRVTDRRIFSDILEFQTLKLFIGRKDLKF